MKRFLLAVCALVLAAPFAFARGGSRGFTGGRGSSGGRSFSGGRGSPGVRAPSGSRGFSGGFSRGTSRPAFGRSTSFRAAARPAASGPSRSFGRTTFHAAASRTVKRLSGADAGAGSPAWATPGAKIISAGQQPVYSDPGNGGTHSVEGGGFIAMDQSHANDVGRGPGISWGAPSRTASAGGGSGASSNGPAFDPSF